MPDFQYVALDDRGREIHGRVEGADPRSVAASLRARALFPVRLEAAGTNKVSLGAPAGEIFGALGHSLRRLLPVTRRDRILFYQQLALMLRTGLTLLQALEVAREQSSKPQFAATITRLIEGIQAGKSLSQAMATEPGRFAKFAIKLIETAEASGELDKVLDQISLHLERRADLQRKLLTGLMYPAIVVVASIGVAAFLVIKIIPKFAGFFSRRNAALPWSTQQLVNVSEFFQQYGSTISVVLIALLVGLIAMYLVPTGRRVFDRAMLSIPIVGGLVMMSSMAQFAQTMAMLLASGVTLLEALRITGSVLGNRSISNSISGTSDDILRGQDLARSLRTTNVPQLVTQVVAVGERTGSLSQVLEELGSFYDKQMQARIQRLSALIEPVMTLIIGLMVGFVYFAFFQAVFQLSSGR